MAKEKNKYNYGIIMIVAIVAIVAIIVIFKNAGLKMDTAYDQGFLVQEVDEEGNVISEWYEDEEGNIVGEAKRWGRTKCADSDGGKNYYEEGTIIKGKYKKTDFCLSDEKGLREYYCKSNRITSVIYDCSKEGKVCKDGTCIEECIGEGEIGIFFNNDVCCEGLESISNALPGMEGGMCMALPDGSFVCAKCGNGICGEGENNCNCPEDCFVCNDSDGGKDYYVEGIACEGSKCSEDFCQDSTYLMENYCTDGGIGSFQYKCPNGCKDGACVRSLCGDGVRNQASEDCDGVDLNGMICEDFGLISGTLSCRSDCHFDTTRCFIKPMPFCGNGIVEPGEQCDGPDLGGMLCPDFADFIGGFLACSGDCSFDKSGCVYSPHTRVCGDGLISHPNDAGFNEECDGSNLENMQCADFPDFIGGTLACAGDCTFDFIGCTTPYVAYCGNGVIEASEQCDDLLGVGDLSCVDFPDFVGGSLDCVNCVYDTGGCVGPYGGVCGDGIVAMGEQCDGSIGDLTCSDFDDFTGGSLSCVNCMYDTNNCAKGVGGFCGDGVVNRGAEVCDGSDLDGWSCVSLGYSGGVLGCHADCSFDKSGCVVPFPPPPSICGNGVIEAGEQCDDLLGVGNMSCINFGDFIGGSLSCVDCMYDTVGCIY